MRDLHGINGTAKSGDERQPDSPDLREAEEILTSLASVFFPDGSSTFDPLSVKQNVARHAEPPNLEERYKVLVEQIPAVVFMAFLDKGVSEAYVSPQIEKILGFTQEEWLNDPLRWYEQIHPADKARWSVEAAQTFVTGKPIKSVYRVIARDGRVVWFHCEAKMVRRENGQPWFIHGVGFDISELKQTEQSLRMAHDELEDRVIERTRELAKANDELQLEIIERKRSEEARAELLDREHLARKEAEEANRQKDEFLATVSHELRTPLTAILGWARLIRLGGLEQEEVLRALETIERNARAQTKLINDLLDISRIISGKLNLDLRQVDIVDVIKSALEGIRPMAFAKMIELNSSFATDIGLLQVDANRLQQVVWNVLSNAIKFTPRGGRVDVVLKRDESHAEIVFRDSGSGISPEFLPYVFERFRQADGSNTRRHGGLGLGLAIVRHLVELHGGTVAAASGGIGKGVTITVRLPLVLTTDSEPRADDVSQPEINTVNPFESRPPGLDGLQVLMVEDQADARELFATVLTQYGAHVTAVSCATEALDALRHIKVDILISDIQMPEIDGYELIARIRKLTSTTNRMIPAVALTSHARTGDRMRSLLAGYQAHLAKPVEPVELVAVVASLAGRTGV